MIVLSFYVEIVFSWNHNKISDYVIKRTHIFNVTVLFFETKKKSLNFLVVFFFRRYSNLNGIITYKVNSLGMKKSIHSVLVYIIIKRQIWWQSNMLEFKMKIKNAKGEMKQQFFLGKNVSIDFFLTKIMIFLCVEKCTYSENVE